MQSDVQLIVISALSTSFSERLLKSGKLPSGSTETHMQNWLFNLMACRRKIMQIRSPSAVAAATLLILQIIKSEQHRGESNGLYTTEKMKTKTPVV